MYLEGPTATAEITRDPSAFHFHCNPFDEAVERSETVQGEGFRISLDDAIWPGGFGTIPE